MTEQERISAARNEFARLRAQHPHAGPRELHRMFPNISYSTVHKWMRAGVAPRVRRKPVAYAPVIELDARNGDVVVFSDAHFWPGVRTPAFRALLSVIKELRPAAIIANGDVFDGASVSRWPRIGWDKRPTVAEELAACRERMAEVEEAARRRSHLLWTLGNHDLRFDSSLANHAPQFEGVAGFGLGDHFPNWKIGWSAAINNDVVVKHRWHGGIHASRNNALQSGRSIVTGHLHSLKVTPYTDFNGTRFGVDSGTLADVHGRQFEAYTEAGPTDWRSGFVVLRFNKGRLLWPQVAHVISNSEVEFGRAVIRV